MRIFTLLLSGMLLSFHVNAQDVIKLLNGEEIQCKVNEITDSAVKYRKYTNPEGPLYTKKKTEISFIKYENGEREILTSEEDVKKSTYTGADSGHVNKQSPADSEDKSRTYNPPANDGKGIARVNRVNGIDVYCLSVPLVKYNIVFNSGDLLSDADIKSLVFGGMVRANVNEKMNKLVNAAYRKSLREKKSFDALIYSGGNRPVAIRYVDADVNAQSFAKVNKINGVEVYVLAEPVSDSYKIVSDARAKSGGFISMASYGIVNSSIEEDISRLVGRLNGNKRKKIDAIIYTSGKTGIGVKFN